MERDQAAVGGGPAGVRQRHVERRRLRHKLALRRHHCSPARRILQGYLLFLFKHLFNPFIRTRY